MPTQGRASLCTRPASCAPLGWCACAVAIIGMLVTPAIAQQSEKDASSSKPKVMVLFDGKSLDGWTKTDFVHSGEVKAEDGSILMTTGRSMTGITTTRKDLPTTNYELRYEAKRLAGNDFFAAATFPVGSSHITFVNGGWGGNVTGLSSLDGSDASENETSQFFEFQNKTWYRFRVRVTSEMIRCWINDKEIVAVNHKDRQVGTRIETRANEPLGFATWETAGAVRGIEIQRLTPSEIAATNKVDP